MPSKDPFGGARGLFEVPSRTPSAVLVASSQALRMEALPTTVLRMEALPTTVLRMEALLATVRTSSAQGTSACDWSVQQWFDPLVDLSNWPTVSDRFECSHRS